MGAIFPPLMWRGVSLSVGLSTLTSGARQATASATPTGFAAGQHLFVRRTSVGQTAQCEYLGKITGIVGNVISFQFAAQSTRATGSYTFSLFTPLDYWQALTVPGTGGITVSQEEGIETLDTAGKQLLHTRIREPRDYVEILMKDAKASDWQAWRDWVRNEINGGLYQFCAAYMDHDAGRVRCDLVKMRNPGAALRAESQARVLRSWAIEVQVIERDSWLA